MKKLIQACLLGTALVSVSCSGVKNAEAAQAQSAEIAKLKGDWEITSIDYEKGLKIKPFDEGADAKCWVGSHWRLIPNNYSGAYELKGGGSCPAVTQPIKFEVTRDNDFKFKKITEGTKAKNVVSGYILHLENRATDQFSLIQDVPFEGKTIKVVYNFQRTASALYKK